MINVIAFIVLEICVVLSAYGFIREGVGLGRVFKTAGVLLDDPIKRSVRAFAVVQILERVVMLAAFESLCFWIIVDLMDGSAGVVGACLGVAAAFVVVGAVLMCAASLIGSGAAFERGFVALLKSVDEPVELAKGVRSVDFFNRVVTYIILDIILGEGKALRRYSIAEGGFVKAETGGRGAEVEPVEADSKGVADSEKVDPEAEVADTNAEATAEGIATETNTEAPSEGIAAEKGAENQPEGTNEPGSHDDFAGAEKAED